MVTTATSTADGRSDKRQPDRPRQGRLQGPPLHALPGLRPRLDLAARSSRWPTSSRCQPDTGHQDQRHRLLQQVAGLLPEPLARLQRAARAHALGGHRRDRWPTARCGHRRQRRRRHRHHRHGPVQAPAAPQRADGLHHREQRRLWPDQGPVLGDRRPGPEAEVRRHERAAADRPLPGGDHRRSCGFVARSFAGDAKQVRELLKAALSYNGTAVLDIISPCVTFNNHEDSTKSYAYGKAHEEHLTTSPSSQASRRSPWTTSRARCRR